MGGSGRPPSPPALGAPRRSRGAPRQCHSLTSSSVTPGEVNRRSPDGSPAGANRRMRERAPRSNAVTTTRSPIAHGLSEDSIEPRPPRRASCGRHGCACRLRGPSSRRRRERGEMRAVICRAWGEVEDLTVAEVAAADAGAGRGAHRREGDGGELRGCPHGGRALPDSAAAALQPGTRDGGRRGPLRGRRDAARARRSGDGHPCLRGPRRDGASPPRPRRSPSPMA